MESVQNLNIKSIKILSVIIQKNRRAFSQILLLSQFIDKYKELNVLEIGSGRGDFMKLFLRVFNKSKYFVSETQEQSIKVLKNE